LNNIKADTKQQILKDRLKNRLEKWMESQGDMGMETELASKKRNN